MNEPIISPWIIYFAGIVDSVSIFSAILFFVLLIILVIAVIELVKYDSTTDRVIVAIIFLFTMFFGLIATFLPSENTIYKMIAAKNITPANINIAGNVVKDIRKTLKQDALDLIQAIKEP